MKFLNATFNRPRIQGLGGDNWSRPKLIIEPQHQDRKKETFNAFAVVLTCSSGEENGRAPSGFSGIVYSVLFSQPKALFPAQKGNSDHLRKNRKYARFAEIARVFDIVL